MNYPIIEPCLNTSENDLISELYLPCLKWASRFDRGVGYFTSGWLSQNIEGLSEFAFNNGKARFITSPIMSNEDTDVIISILENEGIAFDKFEAALLINVATLKVDLEANILNTCFTSESLSDSVIISFLSVSFTSPDSIIASVIVLSVYGSAALLINAVERPEGIINVNNNAADKNLFI